TLIDVDPDTPTSRVSKIRPLADHIAKGLNWEPSRVRIFIARSIEAVADMMLNEQADLLVDSTYPTLLVQQRARSHIILQSPVDGQRTYSSLIVVPANEQLRTLDDLRGRMIALQEEYSTSGYLVPAALLTEAGFRLQRVLTPDDVAEDAIGFQFSGDEENTLAMLRDGLVVAGAISSQDYEQLPAEVQNEFRVIARSRAVPRKLASIRDGFDAKLLDRLTRILIDIDDHDRATMVNAGGWNWEFVELDQRSLDDLAEIGEMMSRIAPQVQQ
ncbi:MAG: PhnD/SsuA/transferrin family substrate-binding protein, partial [Proteobacteria bacterium]|nr:PhnD/SsuA/transferrin family substrate-binding protein [Pseudomonadota bacterium]